MRFGCHVAISKGPAAAVAYAVARGCEAVQIFSSNPRGWQLSKVGPDEDRALLDALDAKDIGPILLHTPYLINVGTSDQDVFTRSVASLVHASERARRLRGWVIVHAGRGVDGPRDEALERSAAAVLTALKLVPDTRILIELTAGGGSSVASTLAEGSELLDAIGPDERVGLCLDTCHAHAAGYDLSSPDGMRAWIDEAERLVGLDRVPAIHCNDSRDPRGSHRDRHWHIGQGEIGEAGFRALFTDPRLDGTAFVVETPGGEVEDRENIARCRALAR